MPTGVLHLKEVDTDKITLDGSLSVSGASRLQGASVLDSTLSVGGSAKFAATETTNINVEGTLSVSGQTTIGGDIIPDTNDAYDIGSPEFKIRDMYVSDNSLWIGDTTKISNVGGSLKFRKRKTSEVPKAIIDAGASAGHANAQATADAALAHAGVGHISQMRLQHWHKFMRTLNQAAQLTDIFRDNDDDYEETSASDAWKEITDTKIYTDMDVGVGTADPDTTLHVKGSLKVESEEGGFQLIRSTAGGNDPQLIIDTRHFGVDETIEDLTGQGCDKFTKLYRVFGTNSEGFGRHWYWGLANDDYTNISLAVGGESGGNDPDLAFTFTTTSELYCNKVYAALGGNADTATLAATATLADTAVRLETPRKINGVDFDGSADITIPVPTVSSLGLENSATIQATTAATANKIVKRDDNGDLFGRYLRGEYVNISHSTGTRDSDTIFYSSTDNYIRKTNASGMRSSLGLANSATIEATTADTANKIALRDNSGDIFARLFRSDYANDTHKINEGAFAYRVSSTGDNYIRFCNDMGQVRSRIGCANLAGAGGQNFSANNIYIGNSTSRGLRSVSGNYGTVQTTGEGAGSWEGYSINGRYVFMSDSNNGCGIFNDLDNQWMAYFNRNAEVQIYYNGASKLQTRSDGVNVTGDLRAGRVGFGNDIGYRIEKSAGDYMTVTTQGSRNSWGGYNIQNQWGLMAHTNGATCGIFNDQDNEWGIQCSRNSHTRLYYDGSEKFKTESYGCSTSGRIRVYEGTGTHRSLGAGSLTLAHGDNNGSSSIVFLSAGNASSDYAWINYDEDGGTGGEAAKLCIGITNDADDDIMMQCSGGVRVGGISNMGDPFGKLETDDPPSNSGTDGHRCHQSWKYGNGMWAMAVNNTTGYNQNMYWYGRHAHSGTLHRVLGFENDSPNRGTAGIFAFTGQHRNMVKNMTPDNVEEYVGLIVSADNEENIKVAGGVERGLNAIEINETLPLLSITTKAKDKSVFGVVSGSEDYETRTNTVGNMTSYHTKETGDDRIFVNSVGEGAIWVSDKNGPLESGDYVTSCGITGYGMKQDSEFLANYTVAKLTMSCDFEATRRDRYSIKKTARMVSGYKHKDGLAFLSEEAFSKIETRREKRMYEYEEHEETVNVLDESRQIIWEVAGKEAPYKMRFLRPNGKEITQAEYEISKSEGREVYRAAFVGCTYHCG